MSNSLELDKIKIMSKLTNQLESKNFITLHVIKTFYQTLANILNIGITLNYINSK